MKITLSYKQSEQVSPYDWDCYTKIIHINDNETLLDIYEKHFKNWTGDVNVELHFNKDVNGA